jgi:predicted Zn-dependent peptidase
MKFEPKLYRLSNGVTVIIDPMDLETVAIKITFDTGSRDEKPNENGITHFCEHMLCKGIPELPTYQSMKNFIENKGGVFNASTSHSRISLYGRIIAENTDDLLKIFSESLKNALFDAKKIEIERNVIMDESRRIRCNNSRKYSNLINTNLFGFSSFRTVGSDENIKSFTRDQMLDWLHKRLSAKNCVICISGRIDNTSDLLEVLENRFNFLPTHDVETHKDLTYTPCDKFLAEQNLKNVWLSILFPNIRLDLYENIKENLAETKFHKYLVQELNEVVRQQNGLVYSIGMTKYGNEYNGAYCIDTETSPENIERAVALIAQTSYRVYNKDTITPPVLERFLNIHKLSDADFLESATNRRDVLISHWLDFGKIYDFYKMQELDKSITVDDVMSASVGFFDGPMSIMTFGAEYNSDLRKIWIDNFK